MQSMKHESLKVPLFLYFIYTNDLPMFLEPTQSVSNAYDVTQKSTLELTNQT